MPIFQFNKLIRDKLPEMYGSLHQRIMSRQLSEIALLGALLDKDDEETGELRAAIGDRVKMTDELADKRQIALDFAAIAGISEEEIESRRLEKLEEKGGFSSGIFVEKIMLEQGDEWINYYRGEPNKYPELSDEEDV
ncbi:hypothetical protein RAAC3_TM7C00001G0014 [Candidatus Saccharibacteria bacterium RAAC3_TM7_1]|nr:hypothetical protein RAAC3_TM7C00001G0014 [Candidatus Saccharibacteria bacterium RAAC3_TM7_1]HCZ28811.1 hypothetical protein [Candidatus Saccharibacteria bacterium]